MQAVVGQSGQVTLELNLPVAIAAPYLFELAVEFLSHHMVHFQTFKSGLPTIGATWSAATQSVNLLRPTPRSANWVLLFHDTPPFAAR
jgi:hypothetical protein